jgi:hypothetical protein
MWSGIMLIHLNPAYTDACVNFRHVHINCRRQLLASSCLSVRTEKLGSRWTDLHYIYYQSILGKTGKNIQGSLNSDKTFYMKTYFHLSQYLTELFLQSDRFQTKDAEKYRNTHFTFNKFLPKILQFMRKCGKILQRRTGYRRQHNTAHAA